jgi:ACR3 family arsenite transporter
MVFVWSVLTNGDASYTLTQVAVNDLLILILYAPTVKLLLQISQVTLPWDTLFASVFIFVLVPLALGAATRFLLIRWKGKEFLTDVILPKAKPFTITALLLTLIMIFMFQADAIITHPVHILMIAVPLIIQTYLIYALAYGAAYLLKLPFSIAAPASMIAGSNFFELAVAVSISIFGPGDPSVLVTTVGVLTEVPVMLSTVAICNATKKYFDRRSGKVSVEKPQAVKNGYDVELRNSTY